MNNNIEYFEIKKLFYIIDKIDNHYNSMINDKFYFDIIYNDLKGNDLIKGIVSFIDYIILNMIDQLNINDTIILMNLNLDEIKNQIEYLYK